MTIKVQDLIASRDMPGHNKAHDDYYLKYPDWKPLARKPFHSAHDTPAALSQLSAVIKAADLFPGAKVLDYGCGAGWLCKCLAHLHCEVDGVDVSERAIDMARAMIATDPLCQPGQVRFRTIDGVILPFEDGSLDRIIVFSSFHHVAHQRETLSEFGRVLKPGGIAVFNEPGPGHSNSPDSQSEMELYGVIENDVVIEDIALWSHEAGFEPPQMMWFFVNPIAVSYEQFRNAKTSNVSSLLDEAKLKPLLNLRTFSLRKRGTSQLDSRWRTGLDGKLDVSLVSNDGRQIRWLARYSNTGTATWLPSKPNGPGSVSIGFRAPAQRLEGRIQIKSGPVLPGERGELEFITSAVRGPITFDLVSEHVAWFSQIGVGNPVNITI